jgi:hypothetical protein
MKNRVTIAVILLFVLQIALLFVVFRPASTPTTIERTPIPVVPRATMPAASNSATQFANGECRIAALNLIGSWVEADKPESEPFPFTSISGEECEGTFEADVHPLFNQSNIWYSGATSCTTCHAEPVNTATAQLDLSSYEGILAGSRRESAESQGQDILGDSASWKQSKLYIQIFTKQMPPGRPVSSPPEGPIISAGKQIQD